jgi:hypothetical protein
VGFLNKEQIDAAKGRVGIDGESAAAPEAEATAPVPQETDQGEAPTQVEGAAAPAATDEPGPTVFVTLKGGREVEVDEGEAMRLMQLGLEAGDEDSIQAAKGLERFIEDDPRRRDALKAFIDNPEATSLLLDKFDVAGSANEGAEDPRDKELRELRQRNAELENPVDAGPTKAAQIAEAASKYPALKGISPGLLTAAVTGLLSEGHSLTSALLSVASDQTGGEVADGDRKRGLDRTSKRLSGLGGGGSSPTSVPASPAANGSDLGNGNALAAARRRLAGL